MIALAKVRYYGLVQISIKKDKIASLRGNDGVSQSIQSSSKDSMADWNTVVMSGTMK